MFLDGPAALGSPPDGSTLGARLRSVELVEAMMLEWCSCSRAVKVLNGTCRSDGVDVEGRALVEEGSKYLDVGESIYVILGFM